MTQEKNIEPSYTADVVGKLELIWGEGFLSPGGASEVSRILGDKDITGCEVLDIGCGVGGAAVTLVQQHGVKAVTGIDVEKDLVGLANNRLCKKGLEAKITYQLVSPGPLPFANQSFDIVFSKDAILHVQDKRKLYSEMLRILRPGGWIMIGDWLAGEQPLSGTSLEELVTQEENFIMVSLSEIGEIIQDLGFVEIELVDRNTWYLEEAKAELQRLRNQIGLKFVQLWGEEAKNSEIEFWELLVEALTEGSLRPSHIRAMKPAESNDNLSQNKCKWGRAAITGNKTSSPNNMDIF